jgi:GNAT superfamily N-acetyltransferase
MSSFIPVPQGSIATIVTHLEMAAAPLNTAPVLPMPDLVLELMPLPDLDWYKDIYRRIGEEWLWFSRLMMSDEQLAAAIHAPGVTVYRLQDSSGDIGLLELDWREKPDCEIVFFGVVEQAIGGGIGRWLMAEAQRLAFEQGEAERLWLHTCTLDHPRALPFYLRQGFKPFRREIEVAPDPRLSGDVRADAAAFHPIIGEPFPSQS